LKENAEFHAAKERQSYVDARLAQLKLRVQNLAMVDFTKIPTDKAGLGSTVVVLDLAKEAEITYKLVTSEDADVAKGWISTASPIGKGLLNKQPGDEVSIPSPGGMRKLEILSLRTIHESDE
jgi:transcription elongation factor GreA